MTKLVSQFIAAMEAKGCKPHQASDVLGDDVKRRYRLDGDAVGKRNGEYQLCVSGDRAYGWFKSYKDGVPHSWYSREAKKWTSEERDAWRVKIEADKAERKAALEAQRHEAAIKARWVWDRAEPDGSTAYLLRKKAELNGARIYKGATVVPVYNASGQIVSLQFIGADGTKRFLKGGAKEGCYFGMATREEDKSVLAVVEGFATGDAVRRATGMPTVVAFDAGNLIDVSAVLRSKYPNSKIVICGDNDPVGVSKAMQAAAKIGGAQVLYPVFEHGQDGSDWNDFYVAYGLDATRDRIVGAITSGTTMGVPDQSLPVVNVQTGGDIPSKGDIPLMEGEGEEGGDGHTHLTIPLDAYEEDVRGTVALYTHQKRVSNANWRAELTMKEVKGEDVPVPRNLSNCKLYIENHEILSNLFCYDEFAKEKVVYQCPPWEDVSTFKPRALRDDDITQLTCELDKLGIIQPFKVVSALVSAVIKNNAKNPAVEYFNGLTWDGVKRLDKWLIYYCGAETDDTEYLKAVGRKWLTAAVARVFEPGCKFDHMLILEGPQNAGKSQMLKELATIHGREYFDDTIRVMDLGHPSTVPKFQGVLIVEVAELAGFANKDSAELKQAITVTHDRVVQKYEKEATSFPRQFVFAATVNPDSGYFTDPTGNRRFWPVKVGRKIDLAAIKRDKEHLWAEAVMRYKEGEKLYLEENMYAKAEEAQQKRNSVHPWQPDIESFCHGKDRITREEVWNHLAIGDRTKRTKQARDEISRIMTRMGWEESRLRFNGVPEYCWVRKSEEEEIEI